MNTSKKRSGFRAAFERVSARVTQKAGSPAAFLVALAVILIWAVTGPIFRFSDTWQLVINTGTTIITFLMVFVIQQSQNKDSLAVQLKLNELIACEERASNRLIMIEDLSGEELETLRNFYVKLAVLAKKDNDLHSSHSVDEADDNQEYKLEHRKSRLLVRKSKTTPHHGNSSTTNA